MRVLLFEPRSHSLPGLLGGLELNRPARLLLHDSGWGSDTPIKGYIVDPE